MDEIAVTQKQSYRLPLPPHPIASPQAHQVLKWALADWRIESTAADNARIVLGELVTNAYQHSRDVFTLTLNLHNDRILIEVWDCTDAVPEVAMPDDHAVNGRGVFMVDALAKEWGVRHEEQGGKTVWATIPL
jgi:anti-sigma regulatory factor (Ser/Thr protein kinase)